MLDLIAVELPKTFQFLHPGWIILHLTAIPLVFVIGMAFGRRSMTSRVPGPASGTGY